MSFPALSEALMNMMDLFGSKACFMFFLFAVTMFAIYPVPAHAFRNTNKLVGSSSKSRRSSYNQNKSSGSGLSRNSKACFTTTGDAALTLKATTTTTDVSESQSQNGGTNTGAGMDSTNSMRKMFDEVSIMFEERKAHVRKLLDEFSQPFMMNPNDFGGRMGSDTDTEMEDDDDVETVVIENCGSSKITDGAENKVTHFCFLVHGYNGKPADLLYLRSAMVQLAQDKLSSSDNTSPQQDECEEEDSGDANHDGCQEDITATNVSSNRMIMHTCQSNWKRTHDGVEKGGERILNEILSVIGQNVLGKASSSDEGEKDDHHQDDNVVDITVSLVGNSLGGLYSRYAISRLAEISEARKGGCEKDGNGINHSKDNTGMDCDVILMGGRVRAHFNIFCTTATPHLGIAGHTWIPLPRTAELGIGNVLGQTGRDIFRISNLIKTMCTCPTYLKPLASFRKRIAYANAYQTDFVVPTQTAAFLNPDSTYPHHVSSSPTAWDTAESMEEVAERDEKSSGSGPRESDDGSNGIGRGGNGNDKNITASNNGSGMVVATLHTPPGEDILKDDSDVNTKVQPSGITHRRLFLGANRRRSSTLKKEMLEMSNAMDQLGWKKVIVDLREQMPMSFRIPRIARKRTGASNNTNGTMRSASSDLDSSRSTEEESPDSATSSVSGNGYHVLESRDVAHAFSKPDDVLAFPLGHNTMVAVEKSIYTSLVFKGGRPLMDDLAKELVDEILLGWDTKR